MFPGVSGRVGMTPDTIQKSEYFLPWTHPASSLLFISSTQSLHCTYCALISRESSLGLQLDSVGPNLRAGSGASGVCCTTYTINCFKFVLHETPFTRLLRPHCNVYWYACRKFKVTQTLAYSDGAYIVDYYSFRSLVNEYRGAIAMTPIFSSC